MNKENWLMTKDNIYQTKTKGREEMKMKMKMTHLKDMSKINIIMKKNLKCQMIVQMKMPIQKTTHMNIVYKLKILMIKLISTNNQSLY